jgi:hypothetical protein
MPKRISVAGVSASVNNGVRSSSTIDSARGRPRQRSQDADGQ